MADCKYSKRLEKDAVGHKIFCNLADYYCGHCYFCSIINDYKMKDGYTDCPYYKNKEKEMQKSSKTPNKVRFEKRGKLYVELNDELEQVVVVDNPFEDVPNYVKILKRPDGEYYVKK